jgi:hypothetical protein
MKCFKSLFVKKKKTQLNFLNYFLTQNYEGQCLERFSSSPMTLFIPPIFRFYPYTKTSEHVFRSFSNSNSSKISGNTFRSSHSRKKKIGKRVPNFIMRAKKEIRRGKRGVGGEENLSNVLIKTIWPMGCLWPCVVSLVVFNFFY